MNAFTLYLLWGLTWGGFCAWLADEKGRSFLAWFMLGFFFSLVALLALGFAPILTREQADARARETDARTREFERWASTPISPDAKPWDPNAGPPPRRGT